MAKMFQKMIVIGSLLVLVLMSGCAEQTADPVSPENVFLSAPSVVIKEFNSQDIALTVTNNDTQAIDSVQLTGSLPLTVTGTNSINIPGKEGTAGSSVLSAQVTAPAYDADVNDSALTISYLSGMDEDGAQITKTASTPIDVTILPDVQLQFLGFVKDMDSLRTTAAESWELEAGDNATITFSVKNHGQSTIPAGLLTVVVDVDNKLMADQASLNITQAMAKSGTSYTKGLQIPVNDDAPNGETDVYVRLMYGDYTVDEQTLTLTVKL
ncbi:COG1361 family protein [Methanolobus profundi]|uniref:Uncharacterized protein n=1 Tax=Methanolobus profundi TaxID=487685 RepID=A0A1I4PLZ1_9EURY|nr:hypothetical protein [Methanolobus profundi]SFM28757.1 hypothetical protein SAMN04488696_0753 [Methanolobus profundi]